MPVISIETLDHEARFNAYLAEPGGTPRGAIVVIQEIFGVNPGIRAKCDHWARLGYLGLAPDLFWRIRSPISRPASARRARDCPGAVGSARSAIASAAGWPS